MSSHLDHLNPIVVRELRGGLRSRRRNALLTFSLLGTGGLFSLIYATVNQIASASTNTIGAGSFLFPLIIGIEMALVCLIIPAQAAGAFAGERERHTFDLLLISPQSPWSLVAGKFVASTGYLALVLVAMLPIAGFAFLLGGIGLRELLLAVTLLAGTLALFASISLWISTLFRATRPATAASYTVVGLLTLGLPAIPVVSAPLVATLRSSIHLLTIRPIVLIGEVVVSTNPWIVAGVTMSQFQSGGNLWTVSLPILGNTIVTLPAPWLIFLGISTLGTALFLGLATHRVAQFVKQH
ncbi:MAG: ABC transporter permease [Chloroflexi bacterium]|nr:ABC transporter permease [Chloroflexota bacterium]